MTDNYILTYPHRESSCYTKKTITEWLLTFRTEGEALTFEVEQAGRIIGGRRIYACTL